LQSPDPHRPAKSIAGLEQTGPAIGPKEAIQFFSTPPSPFSAAKAPPDAVISRSLYLWWLLGDRYRHITEKAKLQWHFIEFDLVQLQRKARIRCVLFVRRGEARRYEQGRINVLQFEKTAPRPSEISQEKSFFEFFDPPLARDCPLLPKSNHPDPGDCPGVPGVVRAGMGL
jgi:hypothetical protein